MVGQLLAQLPPPIAVGLFTAAIVGGIDLTAGFLNMQPPFDLGGIVATGGAAAAASGVYFWAIR